MPFIRVRPDGLQTWTNAHGIRTHMQLAEASGLSLATVQRICSGRPVDGKTMARLLLLLGCPWEAIFRVVEDGERAA